MDEELPQSSWNRDVQILQTVTNSWSGTGFAFYLCNANTDFTRQRGFLKDWGA